MTDANGSQDFLAACDIAPEVLDLRPDYRVLLLVAQGLTPDAPTSTGEELLQEAEAHARALLADTPVEQLAHVAAWREAYRAFGAKPQRTRRGAAVPRCRCHGPAQGHRRGLRRKGPVPADRVLTPDKPSGGVMSPA